MGKAIGGLPEAAPLAAPTEAEESFALGSWLAKQRELRGISREELSALTRLPLRSLERLEAGAFDGQQDGFVRGFVRTVAIAIGLDPDDAVARLLAEPAARPRRRALDPRRVAAAAVGLLGAAVLAAALVEWVQEEPAAPNDAVEDAAILRTDPVRALAIEHGLLGDEPSAAPAEALPFEPLPIGPPEPLSPGLEPATEPGPEAPARPAPQ